MRTLREGKKLTKSEETRLEKALVRLVGSTRRTRRAKNLLEIAQELAIAEELLLSWYADQVENFSSILCEVPDHKRTCIAVLQKDLA